MIRYYMRAVAPDDVCLVDRLPCFRTEVVVERLCKCARCGLAWFAEVGTTTEHRCGGRVERFEVPTNVEP